MYTDEDTLPHRKPKADLVLEHGVVRQRLQFDPTRRELDLPAISLGFGTLAGDDVMIVASHRQTFAIFFDNGGVQECTASKLAVAGKAPIDGKSVGEVIATANKVRQLLQQSMFRKSKEDWYQRTARHLFPNSRVSVLEFVKDRVGALIFFILAITIIVLVIQLQKKKGEQQSTECCLAKEYPRAPQEPEQESFLNDLIRAV